jgi:hypothetical protein
LMVAKCGIDIGYLKSMFQAPLRLGDKGALSFSRDG